MYEVEARKPKTVSVLDGLCLISTLLMYEVEARKPKTVSVLDGLCLISTLLMYEVEARKPKTVSVLDGLCLISTLLMYEVEARKPKTVSVLDGLSRLETISYVTHSLVQNKYDCFSRHDIFVNMNMLTKNLNIQVIAFCVILRDSIAQKSPLIVDWACKNY